MEVSLLDKSNKNKDDRMRKSDCFMTKMNYEWRTFRETNLPQTIGVLILLFHIKKKFVILYVYCNTIDRRGCEGGFRNGKQDNSSDWNEQFHRNSKESLLLY